MKLTQTISKPGVPVLWWRSVGHTHTAFVMETMWTSSQAAGNGMRWRSAATYWASIRAC